LTIPFAVQPAQVTRKLQEFTQKIWLKPDDFTSANLQSRLRPVFLPMWLVDCEVKGHWQAEAGFNYQVKSSQETFQSGSWHTQEIIKTRIRWEPRLGTITRKYNNVAVPALSDDAQRVNKLGKFQLDRAIAYDRRSLENTAIMVPDLSPENAWPIAQDFLNRIALEECQKAVSADHFRNFSIQPEYTGPVWTQLLLPVYFTYYTTDDDQRIPVYIHGQTGTVAGPRLSSQRKGWKWASISAAIAAGLFLLTLLCFAGTTLFPFLSVLGLVLGICAFSAAAFAIIPAVYPWQWNRRQQSERVVLVPNKDKSEPKP
jgi:hypothetical protein